MYRHKIWLFMTSMFLAFLFVDGFSQEAKFDTRPWSISYWQKMAQMGLVEVAKATRVPPAVYTGSNINASVVLNNESTDVPVINATDVTQSENSVFVNPLDNNKLLNSNNSSNYPMTVFYGTSGFFTTDGGSTWNGNVTGTGGSNNGDPSTAIDLSNRYYVSYIATDWGQGCAYSINEGGTWTHVQVVSGPPGGYPDLLDKNHLWVDNGSSSAYQGNIYSAWTRFESGHVNDGDIELARSTNGGLNWSNLGNISDAVNAGSHNQGVNIQTGPAGEVYAVWAIYDSWPSDETALGFTKSTNGGSSFIPATRIISNIKGVRISGVNKNGIRSNSFPSMAVDISGGPHNGWIYIVWSNVGVPGTNQGPDIDVYMIRSTDGGSSWSTPVRVNQDVPGLGKKHFFPWITCDPENGLLSVIFYDDRNESSTECETFVAVSTNGGNSWEDFKVSDIAFTPSPIPGFAYGYFGDYLGISSRGGKVYPVWTDNRTGNALAYVSPFEFNFITVDQTLSDGTSVDSVGHWEGGPDFISYKVSQIFPFRIGSTEVLRGAQKIISSEKYHKWSKDDTVTNHREFKITENFPNRLVSKFEPTKNDVTLRNDLLSAPGNE